MICGGSTVKLKKISIKGLYDMFDYKISFFDDITFIHGINGSGKTTILEIISSIISGNISRLKNWKFDRVNLNYSDNDGNAKFILINRQEDNTNKYECIFVVNFNSSEYNIPILNDSLLSMNPKISTDIDELSLKIKEEFPVIYIPLLRNKNLIRDKYSIFASYINKKPMDSLDDVLLKEIDNLLSFKTKISHKENKLNNNFLRELMTHLTESNINTEESILEKIKEISTVKNLEDEIKRLEETLTELDKLYGLNLKQSSMIDKLPIILQKCKTNKKNNIVYELMLMFSYYKLSQIKQIINLYEDFKKQKEELEKPLINFLAVINDFYDTGHYGKRIKFSIDGNYILIQKNFDNTEKILCEYDLSSGEEQIFILLANLVTNLSNDTQEGIYIIDEPELSLHMEWQLKLVDAIFKINPKVQLIFATHSPDIISHYDSRAIRLI